MHLFDLKRHVGLVEQLVGPGDLAALVDLADGDHEAQRRKHGEQVPQLAGVPVRDLHRVDRDGDASALAQHRGDLIDVAPADHPEVCASNPEPREALTERRAGGFFDGDEQHRAGGAVEDAGGQRALARPRWASEHHEGLAAHHDAGASRELLDLVGLTHQVGGAGDLQRAVNLGSSTSAELVDAARLPAPGAERGAVVVGISALKTPPNHRGSYSLAHALTHPFGGRELFLCG